MSGPGLLGSLEDNGKNGPLPMHMPGHKRNPARFPFLAPLGGGMDITEIEGFDDLHQAQGILKHEMERAARVFGAERSFFLVNGSTCGLLAAIHALAGRGGRAIVARNCHKSVYHGLELCRLSPRWLRPDWCAPLGLWGSVPPEEVARALAETPGARFVLLTSPTYDGILSDIPAIARLCRQADVPLIVDQAHGAHLGLGGFPPSAVAQGADIVVQSAHKTLPSLTQTALLHLSGDRVDGRRVARALNLFESSSPSYLFMASLSGCVDWLERGGVRCFAPWQEGLAAFDREISGLERLQVPNHGALAGENWPGVFSWEPSKLVIFTAAAGRTGPRLADLLRERFQIELEMSRAHCATALTGAGDCVESLTRLARALMVLDREPGSDRPVCPGPPPPFPTAHMPAWEALSAPARAVPPEQAAGQVSAQYLWAYPPGIPLIVPGEEITAALLEQAAAMAHSGVALRSSPEGDGGWLVVEM